MSRELLLSTAVALALSAGASAQIQVRVQAPIAVAVPGGAIATPVDDPDNDGGVAVELFENPNLDRYLRKAQNFLAAEKYEDAIEVLQNVIEGRTIEAFGAEGEGDKEGSGDGDKPKDDADAGKDKKDEKKEEKKEKKPAPRGNTTPAQDPAKQAALERAKREQQSRLSDPSQTVFSQDKRLYRPVRRLCHELLSKMPPEALDLYRSRFEVAAAQLLANALRDGSLQALEQVGNRYFVTLAAGRAMVTLADRLMHLGRYRAAVQVLRDVSEVYPADGRQKVGVSEVWCRFKIALCMALAGEGGVARDAVQRLAASFPNETLRIAGELQPVRDLADSPFFAVGGKGELAALPNVRARSWIDTGASELVPLWQVRFTSRQPYEQTSRGGNQDQVGWNGEGSIAYAAPKAWQYGTGTSVAFRGDATPDRAVFYDNFRLRVADAFTGLLTSEGDGEIVPPTPKSNNPRARVPAYDHALLRSVEDDARYYCVLGYQGKSMSVEALKVTDLVAYDKATMKRAWSSKDWYDGDEGLKDVTYLAAPTVFGERLLLPVLVRSNYYALQCLDRHTGQPVWRTRLHAGGSIFVKAPGTPTAVMGGIAYVLTNAGVLAAVDAFAGELKWIRRYERHDQAHQPHKKLSAPRNQNGRFGGGMQFSEADLPSFLPGEIILAEGLVVFAPCDSDVLFCIDGATGEPTWIMDGVGSFAPYGRLQCIVGANDKYLFVASDTDLVCIGLKSGLRYWNKPLPQDDRLTRWRGRGLVLGDTVLMPGAREVLVYDANGKQDVRRLPLPALGVGQEPLAGPCNLAVAGPWLGVAYQGGIEVYSTASALRELAAATTSPLRRSSFQVQAGDFDAALTTLETWLQDPQLPAEDRTRGANKLLNLARERALQLAAEQQVDAGIALLDRVRPYAVDRNVRMQWHVARLDVWKQAQDLRACEAEQLRLYRFMEGKE